MSKFKHCEPVVHYIANLIRFMLVDSLAEQRGIGGNRVTAITIAFGGILAIVLLLLALCFPLHFALHEAPGFLQSASYFAFSTLFFLTFLAVVTILGWAVLNQLPSAKDQRDRVAEQFVAAFGVGVWLLCIVSMVLGLAGVLNANTVRCCFAILIVVATVIVTRYWNATKWETFYQALRSIKQQKLIVVPIVLFLLLQVMFCMLPTMDWDSAGYQLPLAKAILERGDLGVWHDAPPFNFQANAQTLYVYFLAFNTDVGVRLLNLAFVLMCVLGTFALGNRTGGRWTGICAAGVLATCNIIWEVGTTARIDVMLTFFGLASILCLLNFVRTKIPASGILFLLFAGMACGMKLTGLFLLAIPVVLFYWHARSWPAKWIVVGLVVLLVPSGFWYARNAVELNYPLFPVAIEGGRPANPVPTFIGPSGREPVYLVADACFEAKYESPEARSLGPKFEKMAQHVVDQPKAEGSTARLYNLPLLITQPGRFARKPYHCMNPLLLLGLFVPWIWWRNRDLRLVILFTGIFLLAIVPRLALLRYLIPVFPFLAVATGYAITKFVGRDRSFKFVVLILGVSFIFPATLAIHKAASVAPLSYLAGNESKLQFVADHGYNNCFETIGNVIEFLNNNTGPGEKPLMVGETKGYLLQRSYQGDYEQLGRYATSWLKYVARSAGEHDTLSAELRDDGFSHIVVNWSYFKWVMRAERPSKAERLQFALIDLLAFIEKNGAIEYSDKNFWIVKLKSTSHSQG